MNSKDKIMCTKMFLSTISFSDLFMWDVKSYKRVKLNSNFELVELSKILVHQNKKIKLEKNKIHSILGVNNVSGIFDAYSISGDKINQPYQEMKNGWLAYNPYRINVGSIGIKLEKHKNKYISPAYVVFSCNENLSPHYFFYLFKTDKFNTVIRDNTTGSVRQNLSFNNLTNIKIPLPSLEEQNKIVEAYNIKIKQAEKAEEEANRLETEIENYIYFELGIKKQEKQEKKKGLQFVRFCKLDLWGVRKNNNVLESFKYQNTKLSDVSFINPLTNLKELPDDLKMSFIPMECVSDIYGEISEKREGEKLLAKGYTKFQNEDLIWARITPCMQNGKSAVVRDLVNGYGYGSTEYHVIRKSNNNISIDYIYSLLRLKSVLRDAQNYFTGSAGQQRVPKSYLENLLIPFPLLPKQNEIVEHITSLKEQIKTLRLQAQQNRQQAIKDFENTIFS